ncbi:MAG: FtsX-like permease family protein [Micropruina sp.]
MTPVRLIQLCVRVNAGARLKFILLTTLVVIASLVFLGVQELSRASSANLDDALEHDLGMTGSYRIEPSPELRVDLKQTLQLVHSAVDVLRPTDIRVAQLMPPVRPECPPYNAIGDVSVAVLFDAGGAPRAFVPGELPGDFDLCLAGMVIPRTALRESTQAERKLIDAPLIVDPMYASAVRLTSTAPARYQIGIVTGRPDDQGEVLRERLRASFAEAAQAAGIDVASAFILTRSDGGEQARTASGGIKFVYALIGWGVLLISGLGLLVAELIVVRDRTWFFGLARAVGARKGAVAGLILFDIVLVLVVGFVATLVIAAVSAPLVNAFGQAAFQTNLQLIRPSGLATLGLGAVLMLLLGGVYPAWRATQLDPLEVLERH